MINMFGFSYMFCRICEQYNLQFVKTVLNKTYFTDIIMQKLNEYMNFFNNACYYFINTTFLTNSTMKAIEYYLKSDLLENQRIFRQTYEP